MTPTASSTLVDQPLVPRRTDAPKAKTVFVVGPAGKGPAGERVEIESAEDAYRIFGTEGPLARTVAEALYGARIGSQASGSDLYGKVVAVRTETGSSASRALSGPDGMSGVMTLRTAASGRDANRWRIEETSSGFRVFDPEESLLTDFPVSENGQISTPSELARSITQAFEGRLVAEVEPGRSRFEIKIDQSDLDGFEPNTSLSEQTSATQTRLDLTGQDAAAMEALASGSATWIGGEPNVFAGENDLPHLRAIRRSEDASVYAITAGSTKEIQAATRQTRVEGLADTGRIGSPTQTLLNVRTTGASGPATIAEAGRRSGQTVSEGYWRVRSGYAGRISSEQRADPLAATLTAEHVATSPVSLEDPTVDGVEVQDSEAVLLTAQADASENGLYLATAGADAIVRLERDYSRTELAGERVEAGGTLWSYFPSEGRIDESSTLELTFDAPAGIADGGGSLAESYAQSIGLTASEADLVSSDRLEGRSGVSLEIAPAADESDRQDVTLDLSQGLGDDGIDAEITWSDGTGRLRLDRSAYQSLGRAFDGAFAYLTYDSCVFDLREKRSIAQLSENAEALQYHVDGFELSFNRALEHDLVVRPLQVTQYDLGNDVEVSYTPEEGNIFRFLGEGRQPGEAGGPIGQMETIIGFSYSYDPAFPSIPQSGGLELQGGSSGVGASAQRKLSALRDALRKHRRLDHFAIVPAGLYADDVRRSKDEVTGTRTNEALGVIEAIQEHQSLQDETGASGICYLPVRPIEVSSSGRIEEDRLTSRYRELTRQSEPAAQILQSENRPQFFFTDTPGAIRLGGRRQVTPCAALWAGIRSALPNDMALYEIALPGVEPLYRYDLAGRRMTDQLSRSRVNTWSAERGSARIASERTGAGETYTAEGELAESTYRSGIALVAANEFRQRALSGLEELLGGVNPDGGTDMLRARAEGAILSARRATTGVSRFIMDPQRDIQIRAEGGSAMSLEVSGRVETAGELTRITLSVAATTPAALQSAQSNSLEVAE